MSVGYQMEYSVIIKGTRAEFEQIPAVAQQVLEDYKAALEKAKKKAAGSGIQPGTTRNWRKSWRSLLRIR